jgi:hypothetical protein
MTAPVRAGITDANSLRVKFATFDRQTAEKQDKRESAAAMRRFCFPCNFAD